MKKTAFLSDLLFAFSLIALITLCLFRYLGIRLFPALLLSALCGVLAAVSTGALLQRKNRRFLLRKSEETQKQKLLTHLSLLSDEQKTQFFLNVFSKEQSAKRFSSLKILTGQAFYFLKLRFSSVSADEIAAIARLRAAKTKQRVLLCTCIEEEAKTLCERLGILVYTGGDVYSLVKSANAMPDTFLGENAVQNKRKLRLRLCFSKRNSRRFLIGGALILLTSLYSPFPTYYLIFGGALLLCALVIRIFGYAN